MDALIKLGQIAGIAGISLGIIFLLFRQIIAKNIFPNLTKEQAYKTIRLVIILLFIIGLVGMLLWALNPLINKAGNDTEVTQNDTKITKNFNVYLSKQSVPGVIVQANNVRASNTSDQYGFVTLIFDTVPHIDSIDLEFKSDPLNIHNVTTVPLQNFPRKFDLIAVQPDTAENNPVKASKINISKVNLKNILPYAYNNTSPGLTGARFSSYTLGKSSKDNNTGVSVRVTTSDGQIEIARANNKDNSNTNATVYKPLATHTFDLSLTAKGLTKEDCKSFKAKVWLQGKRDDDDWKFDGTVTLIFSDGSTLQSRRPGITLDGNNASVVFSAQ